MATFDSAKNMRRDAHSGSIAPGKDADLLLVDGDPTKDIADLRKIRVVIVRGHVLDPTALRDALR
jgi:imidazolonepropionase-like amidohydrolase